jgi:hypothetical protein
MLSLKINTIRKTEWSLLLQQFDDATIYQMWSCGAVLWGENSLRHIVFKDGNEIAGLAQLAVIKPPLIRAGTALLFWGPLWRRSGKQEDLSFLSDIIELLRTEYVEKQGLFLRVIPNEMKRDIDGVRAVFESRGFHWKGRFYRTYLLDITPSTDYLRKALQQKWRNCLNRAERENLTITDSTSLESYAAFYEIFQEMHKRKQIADISIDPKQLREIHRDLPPDLKTRIFLCMKGENPLAGAVVSATGDTAILLLAASSPDGRKVMASYLLQWKIIEWLKAKGIRSYDLGGISPSAPWVNHFKAGLGGTAVSHAGLFEQCTNPASSLFDRSLGIMKNYRNHLGKAVRKLQGFL